MNIFKLSIVALAASATFVATAEQYRFVALDNSIATKMCITSAVNDLKALKKATNRYERGDRNLLANAYVCNDMSIAQFSYKYGANNTAKFLDKYSKRHNKIPKTSVEIRDLAMQGEDSVRIIYVGVAPK